MNNFTAPTCSICNKLLFTSFLYRWNDNNNDYDRIPLLNGMVVTVPQSFLCQGHTFTECPTCTLMVPDGYHTSDDCECLASIVDKKRTEIPKAFYDAFDEEK